MRDALVYLGLAFFPVMIPLVLYTLGMRDRLQRAETTIRDIALEGARRGASVPRESQDVYQALDAIALEVERISEGQRFTTKLLSENRASPGDGRVNTPH
ncbi:MAG TPA: hypothetical protein VF034_07205 [Gemmatimonadaceae bacterium]|jgi:hypothetical protein